MCGGGGSVSYPSPDANQVQLEQKQIDLLNQQQTQMSQLQPLLAEQFGYEPVYGPDVHFQTLVQQLRAANAVGDTATAQKLGQQYAALYPDHGDPDTIPQVVTGYKKTDARAALDAQIAPLQQQAFQLAKSQMDWQQKALNGELPVSDALVQQKALDYSKLKEQLGQMGDSIIGDEPGSAVAKSTSGQQALTEFNKRYQALEDEERRGIMTQMNGSQNASVGTVGGGQQLTRSGVPYSPFDSLMGGYTSAMSPYLQQQQGMYQANLANSQMANQRQTGLMQLGGQLGSAGLMYAALA